MQEASEGEDQLKLDNKVRDLEAAVQKLEKECEAKEAVLEDVLCSINQLPRHPRNTALIANVLNSRLTLPENVLDGFECQTAWKILFCEHICVAIDVNNDTPQTVLPSCASFCSTDLSDTVAVIFDDLKIAHSIPPKSKRRVVVSFEKGLLLNGQVTIVLDCEFVDASNTDIHLPLLPLLPSFSCSKQSRVVKVFDVDESLRKLCLARVDDLSLKEGLELYQCLYTSYFSELLDITPSRLRTILREIGKFVEADFGDWQLFVGETDTVWNDFMVYVNSSCMEGSSAQCRIFAKSECDVRRLSQKLIENDRILWENVK